MSLAISIFSPCLCFVVIALSLYNDVASSGGKSTKNQDAVHFVSLVETLHSAPSV